VRRVVVSWAEPPGGEVEYVVDGSPVGSGDAGFDRVLALVADTPGTEVVLRVGALGLGGQSLSGSLPFEERLGELLSAVGGEAGRISYVFG
jgi:hypothetical protein